MSVSANFAAVAGLCLAVMFLLHILRRTPKRNDLPPGPPRIPFLGNIHQLPKVDQYLTFMEWAAQYGDIVYAEILTQPIVILSSAKAAFDLMEKRGARYSNKPRFVYFVELVGWTGNLGFVQYNETWRRMRKWYQRAFIARSSADSYHPAQYRQVRRLLVDLLENPVEFEHQLKRYSAGIVLEIGYGHTVTSLDDDHFIKVTEDGLRECLAGSGAGVASVDFLPILRYLPAWLPGMHFKYSAAKARKAIEDMEDMPYRTVKNDMANDRDCEASFTTDLIEECSRKGTLTAEDERDIKGAAGTLYAAGTDTSLTSMLVFILVMVQYPEVLKKAQLELTCVVGDSRLPDFRDRASLPYLECIIREVYRWCPAITACNNWQNLSIPCSACGAEDDVYGTYYIPKGSMIMANLWAIFRDPEMYPEPDVFKPERFLTIDADEDFKLKDPKKMMFGFGRSRICPGRYFADDNVWLAAACIIATLDIGKARNDHGQEITPAPRFISGTIMHPEPFVCDIRPRSEKSRQVILDSSTEN
ncbi:cytochrome P450 [Fomitopsis serialis]|uniref:cytochrome P450 n=1 Tax=Fomitopsis serialis TaxID=139415 RepID=UPI0020077405|nr:cytochrome P450 [Neoantrodia serialis]KAH9917066.1 cytochrome P450 [Neoantrodia serialis]